MATESPNRAASPPASGAPPDALQGDDRPPVGRGGARAPSPTSRDPGEQDRPSRASMSGARAGPVAYITTSRHITTIIKPQPLAAALQ